MILLLLAAQVADTLPELPEAERFDACVSLSINSPEQGAAEATQWRIAGGDFLAAQCLGMAYSQLERFGAAAEAFEEAARAAEVAQDDRAARYWAQAGNAWLADRQPAKARAALDAALVAGTLEGLALGEAHLDRARALVAADQPRAARPDLDAALEHASADPLAWLLSATLARRTGNLARARIDIAGAITRADDDPSVQLEAGNIAAAGGDATGAQAAWGKVILLAPDSPQASAARSALAQFDTP